MACLLLLLVLGVRAEAALTVQADATPLIGNAPLSVDFSGTINQCLPITSPPSIVQVGQGANQTSVANFTIKNISNQPMTIWHMSIVTGNANALIAVDVDGRSPDAISPAYGTNTQAYDVWFGTGGAGASNNIVIPPRSSITIVLTYDTPLASGNKDLALGFYDEFDQAIGETGNKASQTTFSWDFGDGSPVVATDVATYVYGAPGTYTATFTATCNDETASASVTIVVGSAVSGFQIGVPAFSTICGPASIDITALDGNGAAIADYDGLVSLSTSNGQGDWYVNPYGAVNGTLSNVGGGNNGQASYQFVNADNGTVNLDLNMQVPGAYSVTVSDASAGVSSTSALVNFLDAADSFRFTTDPIQVAGRPQAMKVEKLLDNCAVDTNYQNNRQIRAWLSRDVDDPGGVAPMISGVSLPNATPAGPNLTLNFTLGEANFVLDTSDVGKYRLNMSQGPRFGSSGIITTRPFGLAFTGIQSNDAPPVANPGGTLQGGAGFVAAGTTFQLSVGGYLWNSADDPGSDGVPDAGVNITDNGETPSYNWNTALSVIDPVVTAPSPCGTVDSARFSGTTLVTMGSFAAGVATVSDLVYAEAGCVALRADATNFLNSAGVNPFGTTFYSGAPEKLVGRFFPDRFELVAGSGLTAACLGNPATPLDTSDDFTYMGQNALGVSYSLQARSAGVPGLVTANYDSTLYSVALTTSDVTLHAENANDGEDLSSRLVFPAAATWNAGVLNYNATDVMFNRLSPPCPLDHPDCIDGAYEFLRIGIRANNDPDGVEIGGADMRVDTATDCGVLGDCNVRRVDLQDIRMRFGRMRIQNAFGSELVDLPMPFFNEYWLDDINGFGVSGADYCTTVNNADVTLSNFTGSLNIGETQPANSGVFSAGVNTGFVMTRPAGDGAYDGSVDVSVDVSAATGINMPWLQFDWDGDGLHDDNPLGTATFGIFGGDDAVIYIRENY